jgi:hypothetical protein
MYSDIFKQALPSDFTTEILFAFLIFPTPHPSERPARTNLGQLSRPRINDLCNDAVPSANSIGLHVNSTLSEVTVHDEMCKFWNRL